MPRSEAALRFMQKIKGILFTHFSISFDNVGKIDMGL